MASWCLGELGSRERVADGANGLSVQARLLINKGERRCRLAEPGALVASWIFLGSLLQPPHPVSKNFTFVNDMPAEEAALTVVFEQEDI